jgi:predicted nucleotide-binding protein
MLVAMKDSTSKDADMQTDTPDHQDAVDKRKVFVVHGRNLDARDALFAFLRAIDLAPIEWEEAVQMTGETAPYVGNVLDAAFSQAQAAIILMTGDDVARCGKYYLETHDSADEKNLTPQARPNVLFEAGMAFGKYPNRTLIVALGALRKFTDIEGRNFVRMSNKSESRQKLADRLKTAGCAVKTTYRSGWQTAGGDFDAAIRHPDTSPEGTAHGLKVIAKETNFNETAVYKKKVYILIRNETDNCLELREPSWRSAPNVLTWSIKSPTMQLRLGDQWCPKEKGVERLHLPAGEVCRIWIDPGQESAKDNLNTICKSDMTLGTLVLRVDDVQMQVNV